MRAAESLLESLRAYGVQYIFGLPGSTEAPLLDALLSYPEIHYVLGLHESIVVGMADGYARASGKPAVANLHTTVGTGNGLTGLFNAWKDYSPVVTIATHKHSRILSRDGFCVGPDLAEWARPVTKWSWQGIHPDQVSNEVSRAMKVAGTAPCAPVFLCYPEDLLGMEISSTDVVDQHPVSNIEDAWPAPAQIRLIAEKLAQAKRPVIIAGDEVSSTGSAGLVSELANLLAIPVFQEFRRSALTWNIAKDDPAYAGEYNPKDPLVRDADWILALGCRLSIEFSPVTSPDVPPSAKLIHVHRDAWEVGKLYPPEIPVVASVRPVMEQILDVIRDGTVTWKTETWSARHQRWPLSSPPPKQPTPSAATGVLTAEDMARALARHAPDDSVIVDEAIRSSVALQENYPLRPGMYFHSSGGGLGWGLPAALGIQMAWPDRPVIAVVGDGSLLFAVQALWTAVRENLPVKVIVPNNGKYLAVKAGLVEYNHHAVETNQFLGVDLTNPAVDLVAVSQGFGVPGRHVDTAEQLDKALAEAFSHQGPFLVDVAIAESPLSRPKSIAGQ
ncbi:MAG: thiamine pyrophosphate-binding protein [Acidimicrobiaceae bacterium]|nr:thiamine pyrophosphate-binding protein [Acidimicrobiaceae bacterium]